MYQIIFKDLNPKPCSLNPKPTFVLIGAAGYIAPRHFEAIQSVGGELVAVMDQHDAMGKVVAYFPGAKLFTEEEKFFRFLSEQNSSGKKIDYLVVCTPNHLHHHHIVSGLAAGSAVICEKPLCLSAEELLDIQRLSYQYNLPVYTIMQLRFHEEVMRLKADVDAKPDHFFHVKVSYFTPRGAWYDNSWKTDLQKSGGIQMNLGIHLFDLMAWIFGSPSENKLVQDRPRYAEGYLSNSRAQIHWKLGIDLPGSEKEVQTSQPIRLIETDDAIYDLSVYHANLHITSYTNILSENGFKLSEATLGLNTLFHNQTI